MDQRGLLSLLYKHSNFYRLSIQQQLRQCFIFKIVNSDFREAFHIWSWSHAVRVGDFDMGKAREIVLQ